MIDEQKGIKIWMFRNGDTFNQGKRMVISTRVYKNYEQFLHQTSQDLNLLHGAVRKVYTLQGGELTSLLQLKDGHSYVGVASGEVFKKVAYQVPEQPGKSRLLAGAGLGGGIANVKLGLNKDLGDNIGSTERLLFDENDKPLFTNTSKGYRVVVYLNGNDKVYDLKILLTTLSQIFQRRIRRIYDAQTYTRIKTLQDLHDGHNLVAGTEFDPLVKAKYPLVNPLVAAPKVKEHHIPKVVTFYPNGDAYHHGYQLTVKQARYPTMQSLLDHLNHALPLVNGRATRIYRLDNGEKISETDMSPLFSVESNTAPTKFVLVSADGVFFNIRYDVNAYQKLVFGDGGEEEPAPMVMESKPPRTTTRKKVVHHHKKAAGVAVESHEPKSRRSKTPAAEPRPRTVKTPHQHSESGVETGLGDDDQKLQHFKQGDFKDSKKPKRKGQTIKYHDGSELDTENLPPLPMSPAPREKKKKNSEYDNLPPLPMSPPMSPPSNSV
ncbi:hypothetical protein BDR26DRAFT_854538 [Obelidium mucronatum]|nr:hypothetical protein BDR26DRAFT_854538 [Obelidium mucronatum]